MRHQRPQEAIEDLVNALQAAVLLSALLDAQLASGPSASDSRQLIAALQRAASAALELRLWAQRQ